MVTAAIAVLSGLLGLAIGSFLNVVIYRVPRGLSIVRPGSACPSCGHEIRAYDNVPVLAWLWLRGRCRDCHAPISPRYPLVELATGILFAGTALALNDEVFLAAYLAFVAGVLALAIIDLETLTLPRSIVWTHLGLVGGLLLVNTVTTHYWRHLITGVVCALLWSAVYLLIHVISPKSMGFGDVRFALVLGLGLGYLDLGYAALAFFLANLIGLVITVILIALKRLNRKQPVPYGVFLAIAVGLVLFFGRWLVVPFRPPYHWL